MRRKYPQEFRRDVVAVARRGDLTQAEASELVQLRREKRRLEMENEILRRAAAYFASSTLPK